MNQKLERGRGRCPAPTPNPTPCFLRPCGLPLFFGGLRVCDAKSANESMRVDLSAIVCRMCTSCCYSLEHLVFVVVAPTLPPSCVCLPKCTYRRCKPLPPPPSAKETSRTEAHCNHLRACHANESPNVDPLARKEKKAIADDSRKCGPHCSYREKTTT